MVHQGLLREASDVLRRLGDEVAEVDKRVGAEDLRLSEGWRKLETAVNLSWRQHEAVLKEAEASLAIAHKARDRAVEEARDADRRRVAAEDRERKLEASNAALERQLRARMAALAMTMAGDGPAGLLAREEALTLEAMERCMERERLETMERQVAEAEAKLDDREAKAALEIQVLQEDYHGKLELHETRFVEKGNELKKKIAALEGQLAGSKRCLQASETARSAAERHARAAKEACAAAERREQASEKARVAARAELSRFYQRVEDISASAALSPAEAAHAHGMRRVRSEMLTALGNRANGALRELLGSGVDDPLTADDACYLKFFSEVVDRLKGQVTMAQQLVEEQSHDVLRCAVTRIFGNLLRLNSRSNFRALLEPVPNVVAGDVDAWVSDHVEVLVTELVPAVEDAPASEDDASGLVDGADA